MKRLFIGLAAAVLLCTAGSASPEERTGVEAGVKMWVNDWTHDAPGSVSISSGSIVLLGPAIEVRFPNHFFANASYLVAASDYGFSDGTRFDRQDADLAIGYMITPGFGLLAGYKNSTFTERDLGFKDRVYGPVLGMVGIAPADDYLSFYGKLNYLFTTFKEEDAGPVFQEDSPGWLLEFGLRYAFTREFTGAFGYKHEWNSGNVSDVRDSFSGLTFSGMVSF